MNNIINFFFYARTKKDKGRNRAMLGSTGVDGFYKELLSVMR